MTWHGSDPCCFRKSSFEPISLRAIIVETFDDLAAAIFANLHRQRVAGLVERPAVQAIEQMENGRVLYRTAARRTNCSVSSFRSLNSSGWNSCPLERQFHRFGDHRARSDLGVVEVDALGKRVPDAKQIYQLGERVATEHASLLQVHHEPAVFHDEGFEDTRDRSTAKARRNKYRDGDSPAGRR